VGRLAENKGERVALRELQTEDLMASTLYHGSPYRIGEAYHALGAWIEAHAYTITGICRKVILRREGRLDDSLIEIQFPVEKLATETPFFHCPLGVDVVIVEPGGFLTGYWSKMMGPEDQARVRGYEPATDLPDKLWNGVIANLQSEQAPDPQVLVS